VELALHASRILCGPTRKVCWPAHEISSLHDTKAEASVAKCRILSALRLAWALQSFTSGRDVEEKRGHIRFPKFMEGKEKDT
jgi:hypothetical protein